MHDRLRFFTTVLGVAFAVLLVFVQIGLFSGLLRNATVTIENMNADLWVTSRNTPNIDFAHTYPESLLYRVRAIPGVARADNLIVSYMDIQLPNGVSEEMLVYAMKDFKEWNFPWHVVEGAPEDLRRGNYVFMDDSATQRFGPFSTGEYREFVGKRLKIIGRTRDALSFTTTPIAFLDYDLAQRLAPEELGRSTTYTVIKLKPGADVEQVRAQLQKELPYNDVHTGSEWAKISRNYWVTSTGLGFNMILTVFLGCLVGVVVVAQTLYTSTMEHLREFGTLKAIGGSNRVIYGILARQALISAVVGFVLGFGPALLARRLVANVGFHLMLTPPLIVATFVGTVLLCLAAAMLSFHKVARIDPALVFRT
ncbi:ABC transporter permease [Vitiosangium sp. GDMCC 1.1324]|uniref:ABC transporter permease n=1 Tax=Vitiosangium sp. (strain GDMCC 1.1324) TaxID=2138576 RepID=UPI00130E34D1|nr:ABC transporter permease [Vitiosangium sp. GDMCC 1.1324]